jgi:hypothetical protein
VPLEKVDRYSTEEIDDRCRGHDQRQPCEQTSMPLLEREKALNLLTDRSHARSVRANYTRSSAAFGPEPILGVRKLGSL